jgi:uncharacterized protein (DUF362 family)
VIGLSKSTVVIEQAAPLDYLTDFVVLPKAFGTAAYDSIPEVAAIRQAVEGALDKLDKAVHFSEQLKNNRPVIIKPNLVSVYHDSGFDERDYPETTDPRVFEAVIRYIKRYTNDITIAESSGKPMPTPVSFRVAGYDRIAKHYGAKLIALELRPVVRYMLPKAEVMKEVYLPDTLDAAVRKEAFYISVPKMKTNLYTGVTLGFKNAMGTIPYFLRERNHSYLIDKKLADLLYLFKPDLTVIDGIIGGEGNTPAPVDPVRVGKIVVSNNSVEADRITTRMMGFDPDQNKLMIEATRRGNHRGSDGNEVPPRDQLVYGRKDRAGVSEPTGAGRARSKRRARCDRQGQGYAGNRACAGAGVLGRVPRRGEDRAGLLQLQKERAKGFCALHNRRRRNPHRRGTVLV